MHGKGAKFLQQQSGGNGKFPGKPKGGKMNDMLKQQSGGSGSGSAGKGKDEKSILYQQSGGK